MSISKPALVLGFLATLTAYTYGGAQPSESEPGGFDSQHTEWLDTELRRLAETAGDAQDARDKIVIVAQSRDRIRAYARQNESQMSLSLRVRFTSVVDLSLQGIPTPSSFGAGNCDDHWDYFFMLNGYESDPCHDWSEDTPLAYELMKQICPE